MAQSVVLCPAADRNSVAETSISRLLACVEPAWTTRSAENRPGAATAHQADVASQSNVGFTADRLGARNARHRCRKSTVERYKPRHRKPPSPSWRTFLEQHAHELASIDFLVVPTARLKVLFVLVVLVHDRRRIVHFNITEYPTAQWPAQQLTEAFPFDTAPRYLLRDDDGGYGRQVQRRIRSLGMQEIVTAPASPWQNPFVERVIGNIRRELLDHVVVLDERHLKRLLSAYLDYYHPWRTHRSLAGDAPDHRPVRPAKPAQVIDFPAVHGLHHYYLPKVA